MVLPDDVISPYKFLLIINNLKMIHQLFNEVNIPPLWEIAEIKILQKLLIMVK